MAKSGNIDRLDKVMRYLGDLNGAVAGIQQSIDGLKEYVDSKFKEQTALRQEDSNSADARMGAVGNQVSYMRETMCENLKETVRESL